MKKVPGFYQSFMDSFPQIGKAYSDLGKATREAGPLDAQTLSLVKLGISVGMHQEGSVHSSARKAMEAGCTPEEIRHVVLLSTTTLGFPNMMAARSWVEDVLQD